ncbi:hypothetical protein [Franconibacter helveticus]|uniref:hypothetical protein n=1 Tax=Franconibacter helveticus TaxID=357240 RepID=UPI0013A655C8|nr:hypothetical protein [Franconibacter helveticus]
MSRLNDYLVLGGEHHRLVYQGEDCGVLSVPAKVQPLPKFYAQNSPAEITKPVMVNYQVHKFTSENGNTYFIATNEPLSGFDVETEIKVSGISPL